MKDDDCVTKFVTEFRKNKPILFWFCIVASYMLGPIFLALAPLHPEVSVNELNAIYGFLFLFSPIWVPIVIVFGVSFGVIYIFLSIVGSLIS